MLLNKLQVLEEFGIRKYLSMMSCGLAWMILVRFWLSKKIIVCQAIVRLGRIFVILKLEMLERLRFGKKNLRIFKLKI